jgi:predicted metalloprotease with PDZ domain
MPPLTTTDPDQINTYELGWQQPNTHLFDITMRIATNGAAELALALPNWRPGRYLIQNYARNLQEFTALDEKGQTLPWQKTEKARWQILTQGSKVVTVRYRYYANTLDAGSSQLNDREAYFNGTNLLLYVIGRQQAPCQLKLTIPKDWKIATALKSMEGSTATNQLFTAPNYDELVDSPLIASPTLLIHPFTQGNTTYYLAFQGSLNTDIKVVAEQVGKIVAQQVKLFGQAPFDRYWFLYHSLPNGRWHGVEHAYSASMTFPENAFATDLGKQGFYGLTSHELFHAWNVKRIMPEAFVHPDYSRETYTRQLWFFEGVTNYYGDLMLRRAGIWDENTYLTNLSRSITALQNNPARLIVSAEDSSFNEWLQNPDSENAQISFYTQGEILGLLLDLTIRQRTNNAHSLDDVMRYLYENYAQKGLGVPEDGIQLAVEKITSSNFQDFFQRYVAGYQEISYERFLATVGLQLVEEKDPTRSTVYLGFRLQPEEIQPTIAAIRAGSPAMQAGLDRGDQVLAINNQQVRGSNFVEILNRYRPGDQITVTVFRAQQLRNFTVTLGDAGNIAYRLKKVDKPSETQSRFFNNWQGNG